MQINYTVTRGVLRDLIGLFLGVQSIIIRGEPYLPIRQHPDSQFLRLRTGVWTGVHGFRMEGRHWSYR